MNITRRLKSFTALALSLCMGLQFYPVLGEETTEPVTTDLSTSTSVDWALNTYTARNDGTAFSLGLTFVEGTVLHVGDTMSLALPEGYSFSDITEALPLYAVRNGVPGELLGSYTISGNVLSLVFNEVTDLTGVTTELTVTGTQTVTVTEGYYKEQTWTMEQDEDGTVNTVTFIVPSSDIMNWTWVSEDGTWTSTVDSIQKTTDSTTTLVLSNTITNTASYTFSLPEGIKAADASAELTYAPMNPDGTQSQSISIGTYSVTENTLTANVTTIPTEAVTVSLPFTWNTEPLPTATPEVVDEELVEAITEENEKLNETPAPTETPVVTATPEVTETPTPTETPVVTPEPTVTPTPVPTETPEAASNEINMMADGVETLLDSITNEIGLGSGFNEVVTNNYQNSAIRDIYWIDNNNGEGTRPSFDEIKNNLDINRLKYTAQYSYLVDGQKNTGTIELTADEINQLLVNKDLLTKDDIVLTNLGGTGHYTLGVNSLPGEVSFTKTEGQEPNVTTTNITVTFTGWTLNQDPAKPIIQGHAKEITYPYTDENGNQKTETKEWTDQYSVLHVEWRDTWTDDNGTDHPAGYYDQNGLIRPGAPDDGWFFVQKMDYQVNVLIRRGTNVFANAEGVEWAVRNAYDFHWRTGITGSDGNDINEGTLPLTDAGMSIELLHETFGNAAELPTAVYLVKNLEKYNLNGSELIFCLEYDGSNKDEQGNPKDGVISYIPSAQNADNSWNMSSENQLKDGDYLDEEIVNDPVSNFGTATDKVYNGGQLILTLKGQTDYTAKKYWQDAADSKHRPEVQFQLWRVTKKTTDNNTLRELYKSAAPVEPTAPQSENKSTTTATITINSDNGDSQTISYAGLFGATDGEKYLPKYDPEGYTYEYFTREIVNYKEGDNQYRTVYGSPDNNYQDKLIYDGGREQNDNSIYDGGAITNILTGTTSAQVIKRWTADSFQSELGDVDVVFKLQSKVKNKVNADWTDVQSENNELVTYTMGQSANTPFTAENLIRDYTGTFEKYNNDGEELEFRWVEYGVYQNDPQHATNLLQRNSDGTFSFKLRQKDQDVIYDSTSVVVYNEETGRYVTTVDNKIQDTTEYFVEKKWDPELNPQPIYLEMFRSDTSNQNFNLVDKDGNYFKMDGTAESEEDAVDLYVEGTQNGENPEVVGKVFEYKPWKAAFVDLKKYAPDGSPYDYIVLESQEGTSWAADYSVGSIESPFTGELVTLLTITNVPNPGKRIYVRKRWLDDGDEQHRGDVTFTAYKIKDGVNIEDFTFADLELIQLDENPAQVTVNRDVNWWGHIPLPDGIDEDRMIILETSIGSTTPGGTATDLTAGYAGTASSTMTPDQLKALLHSIYDVQHPDNTTPAESNEFQYHTENHPYEAFYTMQHLEDVEFYTVTNRRLGTVNINVTKNWLDGSEGTALSENRQNLIKALENAGYQLVVKLVPSDIQDDDVSIENIKIDYAKGTVNLGGREVTIDNANGEDTHRAILPIDNNSNTSTYRFHGLPKYNTLGKLVRYDVIEGAQKNGTTEVVSIQEALKEAGVTGTFDYGFSKWQNSYVISDDHNTDTQTMTIQNKLSGTKDVHFWKEWDDAYRYNNGQRPDLYLTLYQYRQTGVDANNNKVMSMVEKYQDVHWESTGVNIWEYTFSNMEKYDDYGNEIMYYADEGISVDYKDFDYLDVYYKYLPTTTEAWDIDSDTFDATTAHNAIHTATSIGTRKGYSSPDTTDDGTLRTIGNGIYVLREDGIFVNRLQANVRISGQKIWANVPEGFLEADLVPVVFKVYQFNKAKGDKLPTDNYQPSVEEIENPAGDYKKRVYAFINISDWSNQKNSKGLYRFELQYKGENANVVNEDDSITVSLITRDEEGNIIANPADSTMIPKYDDAGNIYTYILREAGDFSGSDVDGNTNLVFKQPSLNDFAITNTYDSITGQIKVKKILDTSAYSPGELETIKVQNPSISFRLERYYEDTQVQNKMVLDEKFSVEKTILWNEFVENKKEIIFENLEIYAPNGNRYRYVVIENPEENPLIDGGYTVFGTVGDGEVTGNYQEITPSETGEYVLDQKESAPLYPVEVKNGLLDKIGGFFRGIGEAIGIVERKVAVDNSMATFKNVYAKEYAPLEFSKTWNDTGGTNLRFATALTFDLSYINPGQEGQGNEWANYKKAGSITLEISNENISNDRKSATLGVGSGLSINVDPNLDSPENPIKQVVKVTITPVGDDTTTLDTATEWKYRIENLPIYSPSGVAWQYKLQETEYDPYIADTSEKTFTYKEPTGTESVGIFTTSNSNFNNSLSVDIRATKNVADSDNPNTNYTGSGAENADFYNYTGYRIDVIYDLYAKFVVADSWSAAVDKFYLDPEGDNKSTDWVNLTENTLSNDYPNIKAAFYTALGDTKEPIVATTKFSLTQEFDKYASFSQASQTITGLPKAFNISFNENGETVNKVVFASYALLETQVNLVDVDNGDAIAYKEYLTPYFVSTTVPDTNGNVHYNFRNISYQTGDKVVAYWFSATAQYLSEIKTDTTTQTTTHTYSDAKNGSTNQYYLFMKPRFDEESDVLPNTFCQNYTGLTFSYEEHLPYIWIDEQVSSANEKYVFINDQFNAIDTTSLKVTKNWSKDNNNIYGTRYPAGITTGNWTVDYQLQQSDGNNVWTDYDLTGNYYKVITGTDTEGSKSVEYKNLPANGVVRVFDSDGKLTGYKTVDKFAYRVLEKNTDKYKTPIDDQITDSDGIYNSTYEVTYDNAYTDNDDPNVSITNKLLTIDVKATKTWTGEDRGLTRPVTFQIQYATADTNNDGNYEWKTFTKGNAGKVTLNGEQDAKSAYYEDEPWHAVWKGLPLNMPGSVTKKVKIGDEEVDKTIYRVVEIIDVNNAYVSDYTGKVEGTGTTDDPYVYVLQETTGTQSSLEAYEEAYSIKNELTTLKLSKSIMLPKELGAGDSATIKPEILNTDFTFSISEGSIPESAKYEVYEIGTSGHEEVVKLSKLDSKQPSIKLKHNQYALIYGLLKGTPYKITETAEGYKAHYSYTVTTGDAPVDLTDGSVILPQDKPATTPTLEVENERRGKVTIHKNDSNGKPITTGDIEFTFTLTFTEKGKDEPTVLTAKTNKDGIAEFTDLPLETEYTLKETSAPGYNKYPKEIKFKLPYESDDSNGDYFYNVNNNGETKYYYPDISFTIENDKAFVMPVTSGTGFFWPGMIGVAVSVLSAGGYVVTRKKKKREEENEEVN